MDCHCFILFFWIFLAGITDFQNGLRAATAEDSIKDNDNLPENDRNEGSVVVNNSITLNSDQSNSEQEVEKKDVENSKSTNATKSGRPTKVTCLQRNGTEVILSTVQVLNTSLLPSSFQTIPNATIAQCVLVLFYAPWCHFSAAAAPHYNALPRVFPDISCIAVNAATYSSLNARYGTVAIPTLLLFHNGQPVAKFNDSHYTLENFTTFIKKYTNLEPNRSATVTSADFEGPLPSTASDDTDYMLWISWIFFICSCCYGFLKSSLCHRMVEILRNNWQEAEAQHEHVE